MNNSIINEIVFKNEPLLSYKADSPKRIELEAELESMKNSFVDIPVIIGGKEIRTGNKGKCTLLTIRTR